MIPARKILVVGEFECRWGLSPFLPVDVTVLKGADKIESLSHVSPSELNEFLSGVKAAVVRYTKEGEGFLTRLSERSMPCIIVFPTYWKIRCGTLRFTMRRLAMNYGVKGFFIEGFSANEFLLKEFFRQIEKLVSDAA